MKIYIDKNPELVWDKYDGTAETEYGIYAVEVNHIGEGYNTVLHTKGRIESIAPIVKGYTQVFDYEAEQKCRALAQLDYERRMAQRFMVVALPDLFEADEFLNSIDIFHHPYISDRTDSNSYGVHELMAQFFEWYIAKSKEKE